jgi:hypothetical protein
VYGASTEDMDALTFGTPRLIRHLMEPAARKIPAMEFELDKVRPPSVRSLALGPTKSNSGCRSTWLLGPKMLLNGQAVRDAFSKGASEVLHSSLNEKTCESYS